MTEQKLTLLAAKPILLAGLGVLMCLIAPASARLPSTDTTAQPSFFFIDKSGKQAIPYSFHSAQGFSENLAAILIADQWGYMDRQGDVKIGASFDIAGDFRDGLAPVKVKEGWGYIDTSGKFAIKPRFAQAESFKNGFAVVHLAKGSPEFPQKTNDQLQSILKDPGLSPLKKAWLAIASSRAAGIIDKKGNFVFEPLYSSIQNFSDGLALAKEGSTVVFLSEKGEVAVRPNCEDARSFFEGLAAIKVRGKWGFIDKKGETVIKPGFDEVDDFHKGLAAVSRGGKWGFIDKRGKWLIKPDYDIVWEGFLGSVAVVGKDACPIKNTHADITRVGAGFIVSRRLGQSDDFDESTTPLELGYFAYPDYRFTLIDKEGNPVCKREFDHVGPLSDGVRAVRIDGQFGYIDNFGNTAIGPRYKLAEAFSDGLALVREGPTKPRSIERNETLLRHSVPALVNDPELIKKDIDVCTEVIKLDPGNAQAYRDRGYLLCNLSRFAESIADFDQVIKRAPTSSEGHYWRGMANLQLSCFDEATSDFTQAKELEPNRPQNLLGRALAYKGAKKADLALQDIDRAVALYDHPYYRKIRGEILFMLGDLEKALPELEKGRRAPLLEPWPAGPRTQEQLIEQMSSVNSKLKAALERPDDHALLALLNAELADVLDDLRRLKLREEKMLEMEELYSQSVEVRRQALKHAEANTRDGAAPVSYKGDLANSLAQLATWKVRCEDYEKATPLYDEALKLARDIGAGIKEADYLLDLGRMYCARKQYDEAQDYLSRSLLLTRNPHDMLARVVRGQTFNAVAIVMNHLKRDRDAEVNMNEASQLLKFGQELTYLPSPPPLSKGASFEETYELALQCRSLGLIETSRRYMKEAAKRSSSDQARAKAERFLTGYMPKCSLDLKLTKLLQKARAAEGAGDYPTAKKYYEALSGVSPDFEWSYESMARLKRLQGDLEAAEKYVRKALSINPGYVDAWVELARIERERGDSGKARESLDKALALDPESQVAAFEQRCLKGN